MTNIDQLKNALQCYVSEIETDLYAIQAQVKLDQYIDSEKALANINASAASSYSDVRGTVNKRTIDEARENRDKAWGEFIDAVNLGGVSVPGGLGSIGYWDLSGVQ